MVEYGTSSPSTEIISQAQNDSMPASQLGNGSQRIRRPGQYSVGQIQPLQTSWSSVFTDVFVFAVTNRKARPHMEYVGDNKLIIYDTTLYTFGDRYLTAKHDARHFEINFRHKDGMLRFGSNTLASEHMLTQS